MRVSLLVFSILPQAKWAAEPDFEPPELTEGNVQAVFNRYWVKEGTAEKVSSVLYGKEIGYEKGDIGLSFDKNARKADRAKFGGTSFHAFPKPTLSPKAPNFPAWWEAHKAEWEQ